MFLAHTLSRNEKLLMDSPVAFGASNFRNLRFLFFGLTPPRILNRSCPLEHRSTIFEATEVLMLKKLHCMKASRCLSAKKSEHVDVRWQVSVFEQLKIFTKHFSSRHLYLKEICEQEVQLTVGNIARFSFVFFNIYFYNIYK